MEALLTSLPIFGRKAGFGIAALPEVRMGESGVCLRV
jgi:hypothetical protein